MATAQLHRRLLVAVICLIASAACDDNDTFAPSSPTRPAFTGSLSGPPSINNGVNAGVILTNVAANQLIVLGVRVNSDVATIESDHRRSRLLDELVRR